MLSQNRIIFANNHFFSHGTRILFRDIEMSGVRGRVQADFDCGRFRHLLSPESGVKRPSFSSIFSFNKASDTVNREASYLSLTT